MCWSVLQCVAVCCSVLQCVVCASLQREPLQHTTTHCNTLRCRDVGASLQREQEPLQVKQSVAVCCSLLQSVVVYLHREQQPLQVQHELRTDFRSVAVCCSFVALCCKVSSPTPPTAVESRAVGDDALQQSATKLQQTATENCNRLQQKTATDCNRKLQQTATAVESRA